MSQNPLPAPDYRLPCDVRLPGGMTIRRGCSFHTLATALQRREGHAGWQVDFDEPIPLDRSILNLAPLPPGTAGERSQPFLLIESPPDNNGGGHD